MLNGLTKFLQSIVLSEICSSSFSLILGNIIREDAHYRKEALKSRVNIE